MKVLHVVPYFPPAWAFGGPPRAVYEIVKRQVKLGYEVTVLTTDAYQKDKRLEEGRDNIEGINVFRVKNLSNYLMWKLRSCSPLRIPRKINIKEFDVVHLHEARTLLNILVLRKIDKNQRVILSPWGTLSYNKQLVLLKKIFDLLFFGLFNKKVKLVLGQNNHEIDIIKKYMPRLKLSLIPLGIDFSYFKNLPPRMSLRRRCKIKKDEFLLIFLGIFRKAKIGKLIEVFDKFLKVGGSGKLIMVGRDDDFLEIVKRKIDSNCIKDKVIILDPLYNEDRLLVYSSADVFIYTPPVYEETSTACLEALACGIPVVVTKQAEIPFMKKGDGVISVENNIDDIVGGLYHIYKRWKINPLRVNGIKLKKFFDWDNIVEKIMRFNKSSMNDSQH